MFANVLNESIIKRAQEKGLVQIKLHNLRDWAVDKRKTVDDRPFGGGPGMLLMIEPIDKALNQLKKKDTKIILLSPQGKTFNQSFALKFSKLKHIILLCGHYEGFDERIKEHLVDQELSIGDFVLTGGELPAMVVVDALVRLIPGVLKKEEATRSESFTENLLDHPQYTRPENYKNWQVPKILLSGDHKKIAEWRKTKARDKTLKLRPDLLRAEQ
jgi:tRNA (guanine37-N1)-methyltransferase